MKRAILVLAVMVMSFQFINAQAYEGTVDYGKKKVPALIIEYNYSVDAVEGAFNQKLQLMGLKGKEDKGLFSSTKGYTTYKGAVINDISSNMLDYTFKVEKKSKKDDNNSVLYLIITQNDNSLVTNDADITSSAKSFLNNLLPDVDAYNLELQIKDQEDKVAKAEKKLKKLQDDKADMEKKIQKLQDDMKNNEKDQANTQTEITNQKAALEGLKAKRKM